MGYRANHRGLALRTGKTFQIAVLMPLTAASGYEWDGVEYTQILSGISQGIEGSGYRISAHIVNDAADGGRDGRADRRSAARRRADLFRYSCR